jgi:hypothetical protein
MEVNMVVEDEEGWDDTINLISHRVILAKAYRKRAENRRKASKFTMVAGKLYKMGRATPMLRCLGENETRLVLLEVHKEVC